MARDRGLQLATGEAGVGREARGGARAGQGQGRGGLGERTGFPRAGPPAKVQSPPGACCQAVRAKPTSQGAGARVTHVSFLRDLMAKEPTWRSGKLESSSSRALRTGSSGQEHSR